MTGSATGSSLILLWAAPRSVSTAMARSLQQSPEVRVLHEPFTDAYYFGPGSRSARYGPGTDHQQRASTDSVSMLIGRELEIASRRGQKLVVKELAFQAAPFLSAPLLDTAHHTFVVRSPDECHLSLSLVKPDFNEEEFGFESLRLIDESLRSRGKSMRGIDGGALQRSPKSVVAAYCSEIGIGFSESMLHWNDGAVKAWESHEELSQRAYHTTLESSNGLIQTNPVTSASTVENSEWLERARATYLTLSKRLLDQSSPNQEETT